jgi:hypothetical protein
VSGSPIKRQTEVKNTLPIGRIEGSKTTHTPLIRYFINDIDPFRTFDTVNCRTANGLFDHFVGARRDSGTVIANSILDLTSGYVDKT